MKNTETNVLKLGLARLGLAMKIQALEDQKRLVHDMQKINFGKNKKLNKTL